MAEILSSKLRVRTKDKRWTQESSNESGAKLLTHPISEPQTHWPRSMAPEEGYCAQIGPEPLRRLLSRHLSVLRH